MKVGCIEKFKLTQLTRAWLYCVIFSTGVTWAGLVLLTGLANQTILICALLSSFPSWLLYVKTRTDYQQIQSQYLNKQNTLNNVLSKNRELDTEIRIAAAVFDAWPSTIICNAEGLIMRVNNAFSETTGYRANEVLGRSPAFLISEPQTHVQFYSQLADIVALKGHWQGEIWEKHKNGESYPKQLCVTPIKDENGYTSHYLIIYQDFNHSKQTAEAIERLAFYDPLTGLPNRRLLQERLKQALVTSHRSKRFGCLFIIDLDNFKILNDSLGHDKGDELLKNVAQRLIACVREGDTVARLGGDEFVVVLENINENLLAAGKFAEAIGYKIQSYLRQPYLLGQHDYRTTPSMGATLFCGYDKNLDEILKQADIAMYQAKNQGRNTLCFFDPQMQAAINARVTLEHDLRAAIQHQQFVLYYQAQVFQNQHIVGAEVLTRWHHPQRGLVRPLEFIPLLEETGLIILLGNWVLETACQQIKHWEKSAHTEHLQLAVNVSAHQFKQADFVENVSRILQQTEINPDRLKLELTETMLLKDLEDTIQKMHSLRNIGVRFSMDDFGTGFSSLSNLKKLPLDQLKIDQSFVNDILIDPDDTVIVQTIISMATHLGMEVIAEGVETEAQRAFLELHNCHVCQGYLFSQPVPLTEFEALLQPTKAQPLNSLA
jgi:diguanylate cyclase (GGDEF)-like protein/PAS domain S-box-containing protein